MFLNSKSGKNAKEFVEKKLLLRLKIFFGLFFVLLIILIFELSNHYLEVAASIGAMMLGVLVSALFVRRKKIFWQEETSKVIAKMDRAGIAILVVYIVFIAARYWLLHHWLYGNELMAFSLSLTVGAMIGKLLMMRSEIRQILKSRGII